MFLVPDVGVLQDHLNQMDTGYWWRGRGGGNWSRFLPLVIFIRIAYCQSARLWASTFQEGHKNTNTPQFCIEWTLNKHCLMFNTR